MKVLLLESSLESSSRLKALCLERKPDLERLDIAHTVEEMKTWFGKESYDLFILNLETNREDLRTFLKSDLAKNTPIIFTSTEQEKILEVFKQNTAGFLKKPVEKDALWEVIDNAKKRKKLCKFRAKNDTAHFKQMINNGDINRIALTTLDGYIIVHYDEIIRCEANGNYTCVYFHDGSFLMLTKTLKHYASKLEPHGFIRIHKTHLVNHKYIRTYVKGKSPYVSLKDGSHVEVSLRKKQLLVEKLYS
jgi:two-component system LytT family response regulator